MTQLNYSLPVSGQPNSSEDPKVHDALQQLFNVVNGELGPDNFPPGTFLQLAVTGTAWKVNCGQINPIVWPGSSSSVIVTGTPHGLTTVKALIVGNGGGATGGAGSQQLPWLTSPGNITATTFDVFVITHDASAPGAFTSNVNTTPYWVAIGT
jgi:hypothetical protein